MELLKKYIDETNEYRLLALDKNVINDEDYCIRSLGHIYIYNYSILDIILLKNLVHKLNYEPESYNEDTRDKITFILRFNKLRTRDYRGA
jgi:hypothetical protein